jgi:demethylmenaquinone methyltransferase/2-methoxy-6-polyprenyl-1,4-benzoquinol methylase
MNKDDITHFGYQKVTSAQKTEKVAEVFHSVATRYDLMNDLMSLGLHRIWKRIAINYCQVRQGQHILDIAGGSGDLSLQLSSLIAKKGQIVLADINAAMLKVARQKILNAGLHNKIAIIQADAENLPFPDNYFDRIIMGFGLRNVTHKEKALRSLYRVLQPGGRLVILEFSQTKVPGMKQVYDFYSFKYLPLLGRYVAKDSNSYQYLAESIRMHPDAETLKKSMLTAGGFDEVNYHQLLGGIVAIHIGVKF